VGPVAVGPVAAGPVAVGPVAGVPPPWTRVSPLEQAANSATATTAGTTLRAMRTGGSYPGPSVGSSGGIGGSNQGRGPAGHVRDDG
jgi:hypothetical protein